jgi:hypothetical protein
MQHFPKKIKLPTQEKVMRRFALTAFASAILTASALAQTALNIEEIHITGLKKPLSLKKIAS